MKFNYFFICMAVNTIFYFEIFLSFSNISFIFTDFLNKFIKRTRETR